MKKYIRTKNNKIYVYVGEEKYSVNSSIMVHRYQELKTGTKCAYGQHILKEENIYKESDDIKLICDNCVVKTKYVPEPLYGSFYELEHFIESWKKNIPSNNPTEAIRGGIWTETGFEYVCELTKEGEFVPFMK